uniref:Uncharacterized protein n=1 Tax=Cucumis melo TaxID=3656 RepID=A0A9I9CCP8_CUCME
VGRLVARLGLDRCLARLGPRLGSRLATQLESLLGLLLGSARIGSGLQRETGQPRVTDLRRSTTVMNRSLEAFDDRPCFNAADDRKRGARRWLA